MATLLDQETQTFLASLPKAELHVHLEGTLEPTLAATLAKRNKVSFSPPLSTPTGSTVGAKTYAFHDLTTFLEIYYPALSVLVTQRDFSDLAKAYVRKAASQNVVRAEIFFDPQAHTRRGVPFSTVINGIVEGTQLGMLETEMDGHATPISVGLIMCFLRDESAESAMETLETAKHYKEHIVGVGLDSDERGNPPRKFAAVYARAKELGFRTTMHCDVDQPGSIEHIRQALHEIGVERIDHGTNVIEDDGLVDVLVQRGIGLTCCPMSNRIVCKDWKGEEMRSLLRRGVKVTVNSDDPAYFDGYVGENVAFVVREGGWTREEVVRAERNAFEIAWVSEEERGKLLGKLEAFAKEWGVAM
ncbi:hypothetical protein MRB53_042107 [Persea americana]|nr:hypothetical protein MRB53_042107 [Persea americana]